MRRSSTLVFFLFFGLIWTTVTGIFDVLITWNIARQVRAESFPTCPGTVTSSEIESHASSDGTTYSAEIVFTFEVEGVVHTADTFRYGNMSTSNHGRAVDITRRYPVGAEVLVHYDPADPADAVLQTGTEGIDYFVLLFLTPFNIVMIGVWLLVAGQIRRRISRPPAGGVLIMTRGLRTHVRLPRLTPLFAAGLTALGVSFVSIFIVGIGTDLDPSMTTLKIVWAAVLVPSIAVYLYRRYVLGSGAKDLVLDGETKTLSLPQSFG